MHPPPVDPEGPEPSAEAPPSKRSRGSLIAAMVIGAVAGVVLCPIGAGVLVYVANLYSGGGTSVPAPTLSRGNPLEHHFTGDLRDILIKPPAGTRVAKPAAANADGTVTLENAATFLYGLRLTAAAQLRSDGYVKGAMATFVQDGHQVASALFLFRDSGGASRTYQSVAQGYESDPAVAEKGALPGVSNVRYTRLAKPIDGMFVIVAYYTHNDMYGTVVYYSPDAAGPEVLAPYVSQQLDLLS